MLNRFRHIVEEMRGLIDRSALLSSSAVHCPSSPARSGILLAVSGGMDSMCLADMWVRCFGAETCTIAHCNFNLRGEESDGDEALVTGWAKEHGVRIHKVSFDTVQYASENGLSIEMAARELRYRWFGELCQDHGYKAVVVAHHADDNAETMVLNMVRGTGLKGLSGMKPVSPLPYMEISGHPRPDLGSVLLRPMLTFTRKQIEGHVFAWKVPYREDSTNSSVAYRRNSIRHEVFPLFERMNPSYVRTLNREMTYFKDAADIVDQWCKSQLPRVVKDDTAGGFSRHYEDGRSPDVVISTPELLAIPQWRYLLYYILEPYGFNSSVLESIESLLVSDRTFSGKCFESQEYMLLTERDSLVLVGKMTGPAVHDASLIPGLSGNSFMPVRAAGAYHVNGSRVVVEVLPWTRDMPLRQPEGTLILDADKLKFPFVLRRWRSGDWMIPLGMKGKKKISDLFTDLKFSHAGKEKAVIIADTMTEGMAGQQHVAGVLGVRMDDRYKVTENTERIIRITIS